MYSVHIPTRLQIQSLMLRQGGDNAGMAQGSHNAILLVAVAHKPPNVLVLTEQRFTSQVQIGSAVSYTWLPSYPKVSARR